MKSKIRTLGVIKDSFKFYFNLKNFIFLFELYSIFFIFFFLFYELRVYFFPHSLSNVFFSTFIGKGISKGFSIEDLISLTAVILVLYVLSPVMKVNTIYYFKYSDRINNVVKSLIETRKYYIGMIILYLIILLIFLSLSIPILLIYVFLIKPFYNPFYFFILLILSIFIIYSVLLNKLSLSRIAYVYKDLNIFSSLSESWKKTSIVDAIKIFILENVADLFLYITYLLILFYPSINIIYIIISSYLVYPISNLFYIYAYKMVFEEG